MTLEERERLVRLETKMSSVEKTVESVENKIDAILEIIHRGQGGWWVVVTVGTVVIAVLGGIGWLITRFMH